jgi:hypothetical protein
MGEDASRFWSQYSASRPPRGGERPGPQNGGTTGDEHPEAHECLDWCPICRGADVVRATAPPELREQLQTVQRDALLILRSLIDAYLQRGGPQDPAAPGARPHGVEDIPID